MLNRPILRYCSCKSVGHDGHAGEDDREKEQNAIAQLKFAHLTGVLQNGVIIESLFLSVMGRHFRNLSSHFRIWL